MINSFNFVSLTCDPMEAIPGDLTTRELSEDTWKDFEQLFLKYGGVQAGCWCMYYQRAGPTPGKTMKERVENNHYEKRQLVFGGKAHGILAYSSGRAVGWCQFGQAVELPRIDGSRNYKNLRPSRPRKPLWRITCFFVDKGFRRSGVASLTLGSALDAIRRQGGGVVEAYPVTKKNAVNIWFGTETMFREQGFKVIGRLGNSGLLMRLIV